MTNLFFLCGNSAEINSRPLNNRSVIEVACAKCGKYCFSLFSNLAEEVKNENYIKNY